MTRGALSVDFTAPVRSPFRAGRPRTSVRAAVAPPFRGPLSDSDVIHSGVFGLVVTLGAQVRSARGHPIRAFAARRRRVVAGCARRDRHGLHQWWWRCRPHIHAAHQHLQATHVHPLDVRGPDHHTTHHDRPQCPPRRKTPNTACGREDQHCRRCTRVRGLLDAHPRLGLRDDRFVPGQSSIPPDML